MKNLKIKIIFLLTICQLGILSAQNRSKTSATDFEMLTGNWQGSLTYLDYSSREPYTMFADIEIKRIGKTNKFIFSNSYPEEKSANSIDTVTVSMDGRYIDKELVRSRNKLAKGNIEILTEEVGKDGNDNKSAIIRHTYTFGEITFTSRKDVQFEGGTEWINRHEYSYRRMNRE